MGENMVSVTIDGTTVQVPSNFTIIKAAEQAGIHIPSLCYHKDLTPTGGCGICLVEFTNMKGTVRACTTPVVEGMSVRTHSQELMTARKFVLELILSNHPDDCNYCIKSEHCELQSLAKQLGLTGKLFEKTYKHHPVDDASPSIVRDAEKCILCGRCVTVCQELQAVYAIDKSNRGFDTLIGPPSGSMAESVCINCGQCINYCPVGALHEKQEKDLVWAALEDPEKVVIVQEAPAIRVSLAEAFDLPPGTNLTGKMYHALKRMGFDYVFDTNFSADLTIMEEGSELLDRLTNHKTLPVITSCSPGWIKFVETFYPELLEHLSSCKSPQQMFGALSKTYFAEKYKIDPAKIVTVSIMPCTAKKFEAKRPEMRASGYQDVDYVITTREFLDMIKEAGIDLLALNDGQPNDLMGQYTGAATIFGATGGVMEAALRTAYELATGEPLPNLDVLEARGLEGVKAFTVDLKGTPLNVAVAHGLRNARSVLDALVEAKRKGDPMPYHFIEIMACPGGCVGGGGQPYGSTMQRRVERAAGLYADDKSKALRKSFQNPEITKIYEDFLGKPLSHKSHELLHTHYTTRDAFIL